jgi:serine/threonine-protein kinase
MSLLRKTAIVASAAILAVVGARAESWRSYHNTRFGTTADVPQSWTMGRPPQNNDGRGFTSPDKRAEIIVSGMFHVLSREEELAIMLEPNQGEAITYQKQGPGWIVVSGVKGDRIFYRKSILSCRDTIWNDVSIEYPAAEKEKYERLVAHVAGSLRAGKGYDWLTKCD